MSGYYSKVYKEASYTTTSYWCAITLGKRTKDGRYEVNITAKLDDKIAKEDMEVNTCVTYNKLNNARVFYKAAKIKYIDSFKEEL